MNLYGFGAHVPPHMSHTSHCFAMNGDIFDPRCANLEEVKARYKHCISTVQLSGPTYFEFIINEVNNIVETEPGD